jgi:hypothetical protein
MPSNQAGFVMIREKIASDVRSSNLAWNEREEKAIDRITALGMSDALGTALFRFKFANDRASGTRALHLLAHKAKCNLGVELSYARKLATACVKEYLIDSCETCHGTGWVTDRGHPDKCGKCGGTGAKRYSDTERALAAGLPVDNFLQNHGKKFDQVMTCMMASVSAASGKVRDLLRD